MNSLVNHWLQSLTILKPQFLVHFVLRAAQNFGRACATLATSFPWIISIDFAFVAFFGCKIIEFMMQALNKQISQLHPLLMISMLIIGVMTFLMQVFFVLFLRQDHFLLNARSYIQAYAMRYIQFLFFTSFITTILRLSLFAGGVTQISKIPELPIFLLKAFEMFALFFWLDSSHSIKALLRSFERSANLLFYTLPVVLFISCLSFGALALLIGSVLGWDKVTQAPYALASFIEFFVEFGKIPSTWQVVTIKYARFLIDGMTVALLYTWYRRKRGVIYATQLLPDSE